MEDESEDTGSGESQDQAGRESEANRARPDALRDLARALSGQAEPNDEQTETDDSGESQDADEGQGDQGESPQEPPKTLAEAAERLGLDVAKLYELTIPDPHREGESFTLGELKDGHEQRGEFTVKELRWEEDRAKQQAEIYAAQQELEEIVRHLPKKVLESDALKAARTRLDARASRERAKTLEVIGDWRNEDTRRADISAMVDHLKTYGFPPEWLQGVSDHRMFRYIRENWQREQRIARALEQVERQTKGRQHKPGKPQGNSPRKPGTERKPGNTPAAKRSELIGLMQPSEGKRS